MNFGNRKLGIGDRKSVGSPFPYPLSPVPAFGFTLIEILVVMFIIGVVLGLASINFAQDPRAVLKNEAEQLSLLMQQARDEAITSGAAIAWKSENHGHAFFELDAEGKWQLMNDAFRTRPWPASVEVANVRINGVKAPLNEALIFTPSGFNQPFELALALNDARVSLSGDSLGRIKIE